MQRRNLVPWLVSLAALGSACSPPDAPTAPAATSSRPPFLIVDESHNGGMTGFVWLPPMVAAPAQAGDIVPAVSPTVQVHELNEDGSSRRTVATFSGTTDGNRVRVILDKFSPDDGDDDPYGYFQAKWPADDEDLSLEAAYRVYVYVPLRWGGLRELGFADVDLVKNAKEFRAVDGGSYVPLIKGEALSIRFRIDRPAVDADGDGVLDWLDNCPTRSNPDQLDTVGNGIGDACRCDEVYCEPIPHDYCHVVGECQPTTGECTELNAPDGTDCELPNARGHCTAGWCGGPVNCDCDYGNCDGIVWNGCEVVIRTEPNCGACGVVCTAGPNSSAYCDGYGCRLECAPGWENCDGEESTGCEVKPDWDPNNCGWCGHVCSSGETCYMGTCWTPPP